MLATCSNSNDVLSLILTMAANSQCAFVNKKMHTCWTSPLCSKARNAALQTDFLAKIHLSHIPFSIQCQLTPKRIQAFITDKNDNSILHIHSRLDIHSFSQAEMLLTLIRQAEKRGDWACSYLLAHIISISKIRHLFCVKNGMTREYAIAKNSPFSYWAILLQNLEIADGCLPRFRRSLDTFKLDPAGKALCAEIMFHIYKSAVHQSEEYSDTKVHCLTILVKLVKNPEGKKAILAVGGLKFLITVLKDLSTKKDSLTDIQSLHMAGHLIHIIIPLTSVPGSKNMTTVTSVLYTLSMSWAILEAKDPQDLSVQELQRLTIQTLAILDQIPEASYASPLPEFCPVITEEEQKLPPPCLAQVEPQQTQTPCCNIL